MHPAYRRQGFAQVLLHRLLVIARQRGLAWATLEVRVSNSAAIALYQRFGFQVAGRRCRYYPDTQEDALILWRGQLQSSEFQHLLQDWQFPLEQRLQALGWKLLRSPNSPCPSLDLRPPLCE